jgi:hypothetical protein
MYKVSTAEVAYDFLCSCRLCQLRLTFVVKSLYFALCFKSNFIRRQHTFYSPRLHLKKKRGGVVIQDLNWPSTGDIT